MIDSNNTLCKIKQKPFLHALLSFNQKDCRSENAYSYIIKDDNEEVHPSIMIRANVKKLESSVIQFLLYMMMKITTLGLNSNNRILYISLDEYMKLRNITSETHLRNKIREDLKILSSLQLWFIDKTKDIRSKKETSKEYSFINVLSSGATRFHNKCIEVKFSPDFLDFYNTCYQLEIPHEIFEIDTRYKKNSLNLLWKLNLHYKLNQTKSNKNIITVQSLINFCPAILESIENAKKASQYYQLVIAPFEKEMNELKSLDYWYYEDMFGNKVDCGKKKFVDFLNLKIIFKLK